MADDAGLTDEEFEANFRPTGTITVVVLFVILLILLWSSIYLILISRGVTV